MTGLREPPTPAEVRDYLRNDPPVPMWMQDAIVEKFAAGGFVDREAIDYEAGQRALVPFIANPSEDDAPITLYWDDGMSRRVVAAAIGDTE